MNLELPYASRRIIGGLWKHAPNWATRRLGGELLTQEQQFVQFLRRDNPAPATDPSTHVGVLVVPWLGTAMPWVSLLLARGLQTHGAAVRLLLVAPSSSFVNEAPNRQRIALTMASARSFPEIPMSIVSPSSEFSLEKRHLELAQAQIIWQNLAAEAPPLSDSAVQGRAAAIASFERGFLDALKAKDLACVLIPGGFFGLSAPCRGAAEQLGIRIATFDSGPDEVLFSGNGVAAQQADAPAALRRLLMAPDEVRQRCVSIANEELARRVGAKSGYQVTGASSPTKTDSDRVVLIPLNVEWDAAALGIHRIFGSAQEWVTESIRHVLQNHPNVRVIVRRHPAERLAGLGAKTPWDSVLAKETATGKVSLVQPADPVNSYDLLLQSQLVLAKATTLGVEAAMMGRRVVVEAESYYANCSFVRRAVTRAGFFSLIDESLERPTPLDDSQREEASLSFYLTQCCGFHYPVLNPHLSAFDRWTRLPPSELLGAGAVQDMLASTISGEPMHWLTHLRRMSPAGTGSR